MALLVSPSPDLVGAQERTDTPRLKLHQAAQVDLPEGFVVRGARLLSARAALVWSEHRLGRATPQGLTWHALPSGFSPRGAGPVTAGGIIQLVAVDGRVGEMGGTGTLAVLGTLPVPGPITQAVWKGGVWLVEVEASVDAGPSLWECGPPPVEGCSEPTRRMPAPPVRLSESGGTVFVQRMAPPYEVLIVEGQRQGIATGIGEAEFTDVLARHGFNPGYTVPLHALALDGSTLLQMADLRSDRRLLLTVSDSGHVLRNVVIDAAVGFVDVDDSTRTMLGLIDSGPSYLGFYDWSWEGGSGSPPKTNHPSREGETR